MKSKHIDATSMIGDYEETDFKELNQFYSLHPADMQYSKENDYLNHDAMPGDLVWFDGEFMCDRECIDGYRISAWNDGNNEQYEFYCEVLRMFDRLNGDKPVAVTMQAIWEAYVKTVLPGERDEHEMRERKITFYCGAMSMMEAMGEISDMDEDTAVNTMDRLQQELTDELKEELLRSEPQ